MKNPELVRFDMEGAGMAVRGPHLLLETHAAECAALMSAFVRRTEGLG